MKQTCGVQIEFDVVEWQILLNSARMTPDAPQLRGAHALNVSSPSSDVGVMARYFSSANFSPNGFNFEQWKDDRFDAALAALAAAPDVVLVADRTGKGVADVAATYFAAGNFFQLDRIVGAARGITVNDYFDRLALDRALDSIGAAERRLTAEMLGNGAAGAAAVDLWVKPRAGEVERIRTAVHEIAGSGLTLSKLAVAASLLGDLVRG